MYDISFVLCQPNDVAVTGSEEKRETHHRKDCTVLSLIELRGWDYGIARETGRGSQHGRRV